MIDLTGVIKNIWPEWQVEKLLGQGSFGRVYEVSRKELDIERRSAVKVILVPPDSSEANALRLEGMTEDDIHTYYRETVKDFVSEIRLLNTLQGAPHIVNLEDFKVVGSKSGEMWCILIRMELLKPFTQHIVEHPMDEAEVIRLGAELCEALEICHGQNIIHRDIKPQNIFIDRYSSFKLGDFGIARKMEGMTSTLSQKGTFGYIAPEVVQGRKYDTRADIYSLGLVLYQLMNEGRAPFLMTAEDQRNPRTRDEAMQRRLGGEQLPKPCSASSDFGKIILKACEYDPEKRFSSAGEMKNALLQLTEGKKSALTSKAEYPGTTKDSIIGMNQTVAVRQAGKSSNTDQTVAVRHANRLTDGNNIENKKKSKRKNITILISSLFVLALVSCIVFSLPLLMKNEEKKENPEAVNTEEIVDQDNVAEIDKEENLESIPVSENSEEEYQGPCGDNLTWFYDKDTGTLSISGTGEMWSYANKSVPWMNKKIEISRLVIESGVSSIGDFAFANCSGMEDGLEIPNSVTKIGRYAFYRCSDLSGNLIIPEGVKTIGEYAFSECSGLTGNLTIGDHVTTVGNNAFSECSGFTGSLKIGNNVTTIGPSAFMDCVGFMGGLRIGNNVTTIGESAFNGCRGLTGGLVIPESVTTIGEKAFLGCWGFTGELNIPDSVTKIGDEAFYCCSSFTGGLTIGQRVVAIGNEAFLKCSGLTGNLIIPDSVTTIGEMAFSGCTGFNGRLSLPASTEIGYQVFKDCNFSEWPVPRNFRLSKDELNLTVGTSDVLIAYADSIDPAGYTTNWTIADSNIATFGERVDGGFEIMAINAGTTVITVTLDDLSVECTVNVSY